MRLKPAVAGGLALLLSACQTGAAPPVATPESRILERSEGSRVTSVPPTATLVPTPPPAPPTATVAPPTPVPTLVPTVPPPTLVPTPAPPVAPLNPAQVAQQRFCDAASPPDRLPLPLTSTTIRIPVPEVPTVPTLVATGPRSENTEPPPRVTARHVAVLDEGSGRLLYERDAYLRVAPASTTKIVTTIVALEHQPDLDFPVTTSVSATAMVACDASSVMGLEPDDHVKLRTLLYGMMLPSGNDAAEQVAVALAGSRERYVAWMNEKVRSLGLRDTHFETPSGMDADGHYSSAYDMALLAQDAMRSPVFRTIAATPRFVGDDYFMHNLNPLLTTYPGADGVKIGFTDIAGRTIVASATRAGHRVYVALMHSTNLHGDSVALLDWSFNNHEW